MATYGYARIRTPEEDPKGQLQSLAAAGCEVVFREKISSVEVNRPQLVKLMKGLKPGDWVVVTKLYRLARSIRELLELIEFIGQRGAFFKSLGDPLFDTATPTGQLLSKLLAAIAEFERDVISERTGVGRERARKRGVQFGRKPKMTEHQVDEAIMRLVRGESQIDLARSYNVSKATMSRLAKKFAGEIEAAQLSSIHQPIKPHPRE